MIPVSFTWDTRKRSIQIKWNRFFSLGWENGKVRKKVVGIPIPFDFRRKGRKFHLYRMRWIYLKEIFSLLKEWEPKKLEGTLSFPDPMVNGVFYGWLSAITERRVGQKVNVGSNFVGENWCVGEATISPKVLFHHLRRILPLIREMRG
jgi:hypothetical protein